jgi:hypothetical protein
MPTYTHIHTHIATHAHAHIHTYTRTKYTHLHTHTHTHTRTHIYIHTHIHTHTHTHTHTRVHSLSLGNPAVACRLPPAAPVCERAAEGAATARASARGYRTYHLFSLFPVLTSPVTRSNARKVTPYSAILTEREGYVRAVNACQTREGLGDRLLGYACMHWPVMLPAV